MRHSRYISIVIGVALLAMSAAQAEVLLTKRSLYRNITITQNGSLRCMTFMTRADVDVRQSCKDLKEPLRLVFDYARNAFTGLAIVPEPERVLVIGLGGGSIPEVFHELYPEASITSVEIDPAVAEVADEYFRFNQDGAIDVRVTDGRVFVKRALSRGETWDYIVLDAFTGEYIPEHMMTRQFLEECAAILEEDGVLVANTFSSSSLYDHESVTYEAAFDWVMNLKRPRGNRLLLAGHDEMPDKDQMIERSRSIERPLTDHSIDLYHQVLMIGEKDWDPDARVLTDDYSPANLLDSR